MKIEELTADQLVAAYEPFLDIARKQRDVLDSNPRYTVDPQFMLDTALLVLEAAHNHYAVALEQPMLPACYGVMSDRYEEHFAELIHAIDAGELAKT